MCKKQILPGIFVALLLITMPVYAVKYNNYKISNYGGGHQIWFEAEDFDERNPDTDQYYPVVDAAGAFGQAITRAGGAGGMIRWTFNISAAGGKGGTWYFWGRVINPSNQSDFMLVERHPGDPQIPTGPPFPGTSSAAGFTDAHRVFEEDVGPPWEWARSGHQEAHTKELQDGENTMYILHRQGNNTVFWDVFMWADSPDYVPTDENYQNARMGLGFGPASGPDPANGAIYEDTWVSLSWRPGDFAVSHDVYFGENFDDVNDGAESTFQGSQTDTFFIAGFPGFPYPDGLVPGTTYYWRINEVNDLDPNSPWKGDVWSFTIPPKTAYDPTPADGVKFVDPEVELGWTAGFSSKLHHVFFGDNFDDVNNATAGLPQGTTTYTPGTLECDKLYYWRIDEFDGVATHKGEVWSFRTLPIIAITDPNLIGWWTLDEGYGTTVLDWSGQGNHGTLEGDPEWVAGYDGDALDLDGAGDNVYADSVQLSTNAFSVALWFNSASALDSSSTREDFLYWQVGNGRPHLTFNRSGTGEIGLWPNVGGDFDGPLTATPSWTAGTWYHITGTFDGASFKIYVNGNLENAVNHPGTHADASGLLIGCRTNQRNYFDGKIDDVRLYDKALTQEAIKLAMRGDTTLAWDPGPAQGSMSDIDEVTAVSWSPGDNAAQHDVYFGTNRDAVDNADESDTTGIYRGRQGTTSYTPSEGVEWSQSYYWRIDEYNTDGTINKGRIWSFMVNDYLTVDDFEDYDVGNNEIWWAWIDGLGYASHPTLPAHPGNGTGSMVGDETTGSYMEETIIHGGGKSMPLFYDNNQQGKLRYSEVEKTLSSRRDWTEEGVGVLSLWF